MGVSRPCHHPAPASPSIPCPDQLTSLAPHPGHSVLSQSPYFPVLYLPLCRAPQLPEVLFPMQGGNL